MNNIIQLKTRLSVIAEPPIVDEQHSSSDDILVAEGLDLLQAYRSIPDRNTRLSLKRLIENVAALKLSKAYD